jgi:hypothetical protein
MAAIMISVGDINFENLSCNNRGVHIWVKVRLLYLYTDNHVLWAWNTKAVPMKYFVIFRPIHNYVFRFIRSSISNKGLEYFKSNHLIR